jgi:hypothetical protein
VLGAGVDVCGAAFPQRSLQVGHLGRVVELVVLGEMAEVGDPVGRLEDAAVEGDEGADVRSRGGDFGAFHGTEAEADDRGTVATSIGVGQEMIERRQDTRPDAVAIGLGERFDVRLGVVRRGQDSAAEHVWRHDREAIAGEPVGQVADRLVQAPPRVEEEYG